MATYYVDLAKAYDHSDTGLDHTGNEWGGAVGLQRALDTAAAGDTVYIKGEADLRKLQVITYDNLAGGTFSAGDTVTESGSSAWSATVYEDNGSTEMTVEVVSGSPANNDSFDNGSGVSADVNGTPAKPGVVQDTNTGTPANRIEFTGVASDWSTGRGSSYQATLDAHSEATYCVAANDANAYCLYENLTLKNAASNNWNSGGLASHAVFRYCISEAAGAYGFRGGGSQVFDHCIARNNASTGFYAPILMLFSFCEAYGNGGDGFFGMTGNFAYGCLSYNNSDNGFELTTGTAAFNCVVDGNTGDGICIRSGGIDPHLVLGCRITNNATGVNIETTRDLALADYNVLYGNTTPYSGFGIWGDNNNTSPADDGYVDQANQDYNLKPTAEISGEKADSEIDLEWDS